jgi:hypothetical protein
VKRASIRIRKLDGQLLDVELKDVTNIVLRGDTGTVRYGLTYFIVAADQAEALADAWAAFMHEKEDAKKNGAKEESV